MTRSITRRRFVQNDHVPGRLAADDAAGFAQFLKDIAVADCSAVKFNVTSLERALQPEIAHNGTDNRSLETALFLARGRQYVQQLITIDEVTVLIHHDDAIAVSIERKTEVRLHRRYR